MTTERSTESRALDRVLEEAREVPAPDVDWSRLESTLMQRVHAQQRARKSRAVLLMGGALALAAAVAVWFTRPAAQEPGSSQDPVVAQAAARDLSGPELSGSALEVGDRLLASGRELRVTHEGHASYTLLAGSAARVVSLGERVVLSLDRGATIDASVVPSARPETFVVEVANLRVAVHGTEFRVVWLGDQVAVDVREGVVAVGPRGELPSWRVTAGEGGMFAADGKTGQVSSRVTAEPPAAPPPSGLGVAPPKLPEAPSEQDVATLLDRAGVLVTGCFEEHVPVESGVRVSARTSLGLSIGADGRLGAAFDPPLAPAVEQCARRRVSALKGPVTKQGAEASRSLLLGP